MGLKALIVMTLPAGVGPVIVVGLLVEFDFSEIS